MRRILGVAVVLGIGFKVVVTALFSGGIELAESEQRLLRGGYWGAACVVDTCINCVPPKPMTDPSPGCIFQIAPGGVLGHCLAPNNGTLGCGAAPGAQSKCVGVFGGSGVCTPTTTFACGGTFNPVCKEFTNPLGVAIGCTPKCEAPVPAAAGTCFNCT